MAEEKKKAKYFCEGCGSEVASNAKFCPKCGKFFAAVRCPNCGHIGTVKDFLHGCPSCHYAMSHEEIYHYASKEKPWWDIIAETFVFMLLECKFYHAF